MGFIFVAKFLVSNQSNLITKYVLCYPKNNFNLKIVDVIENIQFTIPFCNRYEGHEILHLLQGWGN